MRKFRRGFFIGSPFHVMLKEDIQQTFVWINPPFTVSKNEGGVCYNEILPIGRCRFGGVAFHESQQQKPERQGESLPVLLFLP